MSTSSSATRATIQIDTSIGTLIVDGFMLPDGSYRMSLSQSSGAVGFAPQDAADFLLLTSIKSLLGQGYAVNNSRIEIDSNTSSHGHSRLHSMSLEAVAAYWQWKAFRGNRDALALCMALMSETLDCRFNHAFGIESSALGCNQRLNDQALQLEGAMTHLQAAYAESELLRKRVDQLEQQLKDTENMEPLRCLVR